MSKAPYLRVRVPHGTSTVDGLVAAITEELSHRDLPQGMRLPPVRALAHQLGISKTTVQNAYDELNARGLTHTKRRQGVFVSQGPEGEGEPIAVALPELLEPGPPDGGPSLELNLSRVFLDPDLLPTEMLARCYRAVLKTGLDPLYQAQGYLPLRAAIAERLQKRGIETSAEEILITLGSQQALDVICRAMSQRRIATEDPAYSIGKQLFEMNQMDVLGLPLDPFKPLDRNLWEERLREFRPSMLYLTTNYQNPTGYSYSTGELLRLAELSQELGFGIIEDDWGSDMLSYSEYRPPLRALAGAGVLYMNSFTKKLLPSMRLGFLVAPKELMPTLVAAKRVATLANPLLEEAVLCEFLVRGYYDRHLRKLQKELDRRYHCCLQLLQELMPPGVRWSQPGGGPLIWLELPTSVCLENLGSELAKRGVSIGVNFERFFGRPHLHGFPIGFAYPKPEVLKEGLTRLAEALSKT